MKVFRFLLIVMTLFLTGCLTCNVIDYGKAWNATQLVEGIPVIGYATEVEACALKHTQQALINVKARYPQWAYINPTTSKAIMFIRSADDKVPEICKSCLGGYVGLNKECADTWGELPEIIGITPSRPDNGYGGLSKPNIFINRTPERNNINDLLGLLSHEWGCHEAASHYTHDVLCQDIDRAVSKETRALMWADPECKDFL